MTQRPLLSFARAVLLALLLLPLLGASAQARRPVLSLTLPATGADAGAPVTYSWTVSRAKQVRVVLQRQQGTAHTWRTVVRLQGAGGSGQLPGFSLGRYPFRIAAFGAHKKLLAEQRRTLAVFGSVPLSTLFPYKQSNTYATPTRAFSYTLRFYTGGLENPVLSVTKNNCRSVHLDFVPGEGQAGEVGTVSLVQETLDPVAVSAAHDVIGALDAALVPGKSWSINLSQAGGNDAFTFYFNGSAMCDSTAPWQ
jgi:hypothetical protein